MGKEAQLVFVRSSFSKCFEIVQQLVIRAIQISISKAANLLFRYYFKYLGMLKSYGVLLDQILDI